MFDLGYVQNESFGYQVVSVLERDVLGNPRRYNSLLSAEEVLELQQALQQSQLLDQLHEPQPEEVIIDEL